VSFHEVVFPDDISYGAEFGPVFSTDVVTTKSGGEQRNQNWQYPQHKGNVAQGVKNAAQFAKLRAFFYNRYGKAYGFRFKDWADFQATGQTVGAGTGVIQTWQLKKVYTDDGGFNFTRKIYKPVIGTVVIYRNGTAVTTDWTLDYTTGVLTTVLTGTITADFQFHVPVRFDCDDMPASYATFSTYNWDGITLVELKNI